MRHLLRPQDDFESDEDYAIRQRQGAAKVSQARAAAAMAAGDYEPKNLSNIGRTGVVAFNCPACKERINLKTPLAVDKNTICPHCDSVVRPDGFEAKLSDDELEAELNKPFGDGLSLDLAAINDEEAKQREKRAAEEGWLAKERQLAVDDDKIKAFSGAIAQGVANALNEKIKGTLARLKANPKSNPEYYNRASVNLRSYVVDIAKRWRAFSVKMVSEAAAVHDLGSIYQALLDYSYKVVLKIVTENGISRESADRFVEEFKKYNAGVNEKKRATTGDTGQPGNRVDMVTWIKRLPIALLGEMDVDYRKRFKTRQRHPILHVVASKPGEFDVSNPDTREWLKQQVDDVYAFIRRRNAQQTLRKRRGG